MKNGTSVKYTRFEVNNYKGTIANLEFMNPVTKREAYDFLNSLERTSEGFRLFSVEGLFSSSPSAGEIICGDSPVHSWFELTYANYLTIPRSVLEAMPVEWQERFVRCLKELDQKIDWRPTNNQCYRVTLHKPEEIWTDSKEIEWGDELNDPLANYRYPVKMKFLQ